MIVYLVRLELSKDPWSPHLSPYQIEQSRSLPCPARLITNLQRTEPAASFDHGSDERVVVPTRLHVELVCFLEVWDVALGIDLVSAHRTRLDHYVVQHNEDLRLQDGDEVF